jgi:hypothetical protein
MAMLVYQRVSCLSMLSRPFLVEPCSDQSSRVAGSKGWCTIFKLYETGSNQPLQAQCWKK